ncbi:hypothetical protein GALL_46760 [mine drainage metagenome]|uniref:Uncharacterized protein n=1 Tax=mine drainage metagenome TaxID=410659 RepID=A0A1J5T0D7_9ZZZZ
MKKFLTLLLLSLSTSVLAQTYPITGISISFPTSPDVNTTKWGSGNSMLIITATAKMNYGQIDFALTESRILVTIKKSGTKICGAYTSASAPASNFNSATKVWSGSNAVSLLGQDCVLPSGDYELCVQFFGNGPKGVELLSDERCKPFTIKSTDQQIYQSPQNISPSDNFVLSTTDIKKPITFRWTPVAPQPQDAVTYRLLVWEILSGQTAMQATKSNQPVITKDVSNITQTIITNLITGQTNTYNYTWTVQALNKNGTAIGNNNGTSNSTVFKTGNDNPTPQNSTTAGCSSVSTKNFTTGDVISLSNDFKMILTKVPTGGNDSLCGTGTVKVKWIGNFKVQFRGIKINSDDKLCSGAVYTVTDSTQTYPTQWAVNVLNNTTIGSWQINKIKEVTDYIQSNKYGKPLVKATDAVDSMLSVHTLSMPLGYFKKDDSSNAIGFTEMIFKPTNATFTAIASLNTSKIFKKASNTFNGTDTIALKGEGIVFTNSGLKEITGSIKLVAPITFTYANTNTEDLKLTFNTEDTGHIGNGIEFSDTSSEYWNYNFDVNVQLPSQWLVPVDTANTNVEMNFQAAISEWDDFIVTGSLPACIIPNSNGVGIEAGSLTYDHSEIENVDGMVFPDGYTGDSTEMFSGFYIKNFKLTLPDQLRTYADTSKTIQIGTQNLIIDKDGISGKIYANNVINYPDGNIGNLGASIDTVKIKLNNSVLTEAKMLGKITLPMSVVDTGNAINYSALFIQNNNSSTNTHSSSLTFALRPNKDIQSKFFGEGKIKIDQTSSLNLTLSKSGKQRAINFQIDLNGKLYYPTGKIIDPGGSIPLDLDLSCQFEHVGMSYKKDTAENFSFDVGHWSFASPQKKLSGFSFMITDVKPKILPISATTEKQYLFKGGVEFVAKINIGSENSNIGISGDTKIALTGVIESSKYTAPISSTPSLNNFSLLTSQSQLVSGNNNSYSSATSNAKADYGFLTQLKPKYLGVEVESIHIDAHTPAVIIKGDVDFYKHDPVYGNGFKGDITAKFTTLELTIQAGAIFGNTKYIPSHVGNGFKYWMVQAQVNLPPPGIVFMTGLAFRGFGAGVYSRMQMTPPTTFNPTTASASTFGGAVFTPCDTVSIGFKAKAIIATTPKEETLNGSIALAAEFNTNGGMNFIEIDGLFNCGAKIGNEADAFANGGIIVKYDFPHKIFDMSTLLKINTAIIKTDPDVQTKFYVDGLNNKWFFQSGTSTHPNKVKLLGVPINSYLMFGNNIEIPNDFMQETVNGFASIGHSFPSFSDHATGDNKYQSAKGFAFGIGLNYSNSDSWNIVSWHGSWCNCDRYLKANYSIAAGGEIDASFLQYSGCIGLGQGWRAKASMAVYAGTSIGYSYSLPVYGSSSGTLGSIAASAYANAEFPNPTYFDGQLDGDFSICGYSVGFHKHFTKGSQCTGSEEAVTNQNVYTQQNVSDSLNFSLIKNILNPSGSAGISRTTNFSVLLNYPYNESFDVQEQQSSGQIKVRTFRAFYTVSLTQDSTASSNTVSNSTALQNTSVHNNAIANNVSQSNQNIIANNVVHSIASLQTSNPNNLIVGGVDEMGAKLFKLASLSNSTVTNIEANALKPNTSYKFQINGALQENINNSWQPVKHKNSNAPVKETQSIYFKTDAVALGNGSVLNNTNQSSQAH